MSFGFSVGDFLVVGTLAWEVYKNVYKAARDASESFQKVHQDVLSLHAVLKESSETMFSSPITSQAVTQQRLEKYLREVQLGKRPGSIVSLQTVDSLSRGDRAAWRVIRKDLESIGITAAAYETNRDFIRFWLTRSLTTRALDEHVIPGNKENEINGFELSPSLRGPQSIFNALGMGDPNTECEAPTQSVIPAITCTLADSDPRGVDIVRTSGRHPFEETTEEQQPVSSPGSAPEISHLLRNPAARMSGLPINASTELVLRRPPHGPRKRLQKTNAPIG
ncbi:MAG: hypothetical protein Q9172_006585 [Xanthocarpia lactea]